jgi:hypothetical protein
MKTYLLDVNVWVASAFDSHLHHRAAMQWPLELEQHWRSFTKDATYPPKIWTDAYLAAFARAAQLHLTTFDSGFGRYEGLTYTHLA